MVILVECYFTLKAWNAQNGGAAAILVADDRTETLITMDTPEEGNVVNDDYVEKITIPSALISKSLGDSIKEGLSNGEMVRINLDWREALPHPDERVEYELWTNSNDECGSKCDSQINFLKSFKGAAQLLEKKGFTQFTPHYITWYCPKEFQLSKQCKSQCITMEDTVLQILNKITIEGMMVKMLFKTCAKLASLKWQMKVESLGNDGTM